jgi:methionyl-tRNA formyltransferase
MGTPEFAVPTLEKLVKEGYKPLLCITQPDKAKGRNKKVQPSEVKKIAIKHNIPLIQPENVNSEETVKKIAELSPDLIITVAYGGYLGKKIRNLPKYKSINLHPSLLPLYRGAAPINYALFNGDDITGNTIFKLTAKMDAGPIIHQRKIKIEKDDNYTSLSDKLARLGAEDIIKVINLFEENNVIFIHQDDEKASYTKKIEKEDLKINWNDSTNTIYNKIRGLSEKPGAFFIYNDKKIKAIKADKTTDKSTRKPGTVVKIIKNYGIRVATGTNDIILTKLQPAGKKIMNAYAFYIGARFKENTVFY